MSLACQVREVSRCGRVFAQCLVSCPRAWTTVVRAASVKLFEKGMSLACQVREVSRFGNSSLF